MANFACCFRFLAITVMVTVPGNLLSQDIPGFSIGIGQAPVIEKQIPFWTFSDVEECLVQQLCQTPCSYFDRAVDIDVTISSNLDFEESRNAYRALSSKTGVSGSERIPDGLFQFRRTTIVRWPGKIAPFCQTDLIIEEPPVLAANRSPNDHFEMIWNGKCFELLQYQDTDKRVRNRPPRPPAALTETVKLHALVLDSAIILSPTKMRGLIPLSIVIDFNGTVATTAVPSVPHVFKLPDSG